MPLVAPFPTVRWCPHTGRRSCFGDESSGPFHLAIEEVGLALAFRRYFGKDAGGRICCHPSPFRAVKNASRSSRSSSERNSEPIVLS